jgi:hypothetical protein
LPPKFLVNLAEGFRPLCTRKLIQAFFSDLNYGNCVWFGPIPDNFEISDFMCVFHSSLGWAPIITLQPVEGSCKFSCYLGKFPICLILLKVSSVSQQSTMLTSHVRIFFDINLPSMCCICLVVRNLLMSLLLSFCRWVLEEIDIHNEV